MAQISSLSAAMARSSCQTKALRRSAPAAITHWPPPRALKENTELSAAEIARKSLEIAASICVYTNDNIIVEEIGGEDAHE